MSFHQTVHISAMHLNANVFSYIISTPFKLVNMPQPSMCPCDICLRAQVQTGRGVDPEGHPPCQLPKQLPVGTAGQDHPFTCCCFLQPVMAGGPRLKAKDLLAIIRISTKGCAGLRAWFSWEQETEMHGHR